MLEGNREMASFCLCICCKSNCCCINCCWCAIAALLLLSSIEDDGEFLPSFPHQPNLTTPVLDLTSLAIALPSAIVSVCYFERYFDSRI